MARGYLYWRRMQLSSQRTGLALPPRGSLPRPDSDDPLEYYYRPYSAWLYRARLRLGLRLLGEGHHESLIEIGYGSGILLPELTRRATRVAAIDVHDKRDDVDAALRKLGYEADLRQASLYEIPFPDDSFDVLVCLSVLEHLTELDEALDEFARVLRREGVAVIGFPTRNPVTDRLFRILGFDPREIHPSSHDDVIAAGNRSKTLRLERCAQIPRWLPRSMSAYVACRLSAA